MWQRALAIFILLTNIVSYANTIANIDPHWVQFDPYNDALPADAIVGGYQNENLYIARAPHEGSLTPGMYVPSTHKAYVTWSVDAHPKTKFEILCGRNYKWVPTNTYHIPGGAVVGGYIENSYETEYIGRTNYAGYIIPGKVAVSHGVLYFAYGGKTQAVRNFDILVLDDKKKPKITGSSSEIAENGQNINISCRVFEGEPIPNIRWQFKSNADSRFTSVQGSDNVLEILNVNATDAGIYKCIATNEMGNDEHLTELIVKNTSNTSKTTKNSDANPHWIHFDPNIDALPADAIVGGYQNENLYIARAPHEGSLTPGMYVPSTHKAYVTWSVDAHPKNQFEILCGRNYKWVPTTTHHIPEGAVVGGYIENSYETEYIGRTNYAGYIIPGKVAVSHGVLYFAYGGKTQAVRNFDILVLGDKQKPKITGSSSEIAENGQNINISCRVFEGEPIPNIRWQFKSNADSRFTSVQGSDNVLEILNVNATDAGIYKCIATNEMGNDEHLTELIVKNTSNTSKTTKNSDANPHWIHFDPNIDALPADAIVGGYQNENLYIARAPHEGSLTPGMYVPSTHKAYVTWSVDAHPKNQFEILCGRNYKWVPTTTHHIPEGAVVGGYIENSYETEYIGRTNYAGYIIPGKVAVSHGVLYFAYGGKTQAVRNFDILVLGDKQKPKITGSSSEIAENGQNINISCRVFEGEPIPNIRWQFKSNADSRFTSVQGSDNVLEILNVNATDAGIYKCIATNEMGNDEHLTELIVKNTSNTSKTTKNSDANPHWIHFDPNIDALPADAIVGGYQNENLYIARAPHEGSLTPGMYVPSTHKAYVTWSVDAHPKNQFEILCGRNYKWVPTTTHHIPEGAVVGGYIENSYETEYIGRTNYAGYIIPGKVAVSHGVLYFAYGGKTQAVRNFDILVLGDKQKPKITGSSSEIAENGQNINISCRVFEGEPIPNIRWQFKSNADSRFTSVQGSDNVLEILNVNATDAGIYKCIATNEMGNDEHLTELIVKNTSNTSKTTKNSDANPHWIHFDPNIDALPADAIVGGYQNENLYIARAPHEGSLTPGMYVPSTHKAYVTWSVDAHPKNQFEILCGRNYKWVPTTTHHIPEGAVVGGYIENSYETEYIGRTNYAGYIIPGKVAVSHGVLYFAYGGKTQAVRNFDILVLGDKQKPKITGSSSEIAENGQNINISCRVFEGEPIPNIRWQFKSNADSRFTSVQGSDNVLEILNVNATDAGIYKCIATNEMGNDEHLTELIVKNTSNTSKTTKNSDANPHWIHFDPNIDALPADAIVGGYQNENLYIARAPHEGSLTPGMYVPSTHKAYVTWSVDAHPKNQFEILCGRNYKWVPTTTHHIPEGAVVGGYIENSYETEYIGRTNYAGYIIPGKVAVSHGVLYFAYGGKTQAVRNFDILVLGDKQKPKITGSSSEIAENGQNINISCRVFEGEPIPNIRWQFKSNADSRFTSVQGSDNVLEILNVNATDAGIYKCIATNEMGNDEHLTELIVKNTSNTSKTTKNSDANPHWIHFDPNIDALPADAIVGGYQNENLYIARAPHEGSLTPGMYVPSTHKAYVTWSVDAHPKNQFEILCGRNYKWVPTTTHHIPEGAVVGGYIENSYETEYIGRTNYAGYIIPGKVAVSHGVLYFAYGGKTQAVRNFDILVLGDKQKPKITGSSSEIAENGQNINISCRVFEGEPIPNIRWQFKSNADSRFTSVQGSDNVLEILNVNATDAGIYKCIATNEMGNDEHLTELIVKNTSNTSKTTKNSDANPHWIHFDPNIDALPADAIVGGYQNENLYIARAPHEGSLTPGMYVPSTHKAYVTWSVDAHPKNQFEILCGRNYKWVPTTTYHIPEGAVVGGYIENSYETEYIGRTNYAGYIIPGKVAVSHGVLYFAYGGKTQAVRNFDILVLGDKQKPKITGSSSEIAENGQNINISCRVLEGEPIPTIRWQFKSNSDSKFTSVQGSDNVLQIFNVNATDAGIYKCIATNEMGNDEHLTELVVQKSPRITGPSRTTIVKGQTAYIECYVVEGEPTPTIRWQFKSNSDSRFTSVQGSDNVLQIFNVKATDAGIYKCIATNELGNDEHLTELVVQKSPRITGPSRTTIVKGQTAYIECYVVEGLPTPRISWQFKSNFDSRFKWLSGSDNTLQLSNVSATDAGLYKCIADNDRGHDEHITEVFVTNGIYDPYWVSFNPDTDELPADAIVGGFENETLYFAKALHENYMRLGTYVPSERKAFIPWRNGILTKENFEILRGDNYYWSPATTDHIPERAFDGSYVEGTYERLYIARANYLGNVVPGRVAVSRGVCQIIYGGKEEAVRNFEVLVVPEKKSPRVTGKYYETVVQGKSINIECKVVQGIPEPTMRWEFKSNHGSSFASIPGSDNVLHITRANLIDAGTYKCIASNDLGWERHDTELIVEKILDDYGFIHETDLYRHMETEISRLKCGSGSQFERITWYKNGVSTETTGESYTLENVDLSFEGNNYTCVVSSGRGTEVHTFVLTTRQSQAHEGDTVLDLTGREGYEMNCDIVVKATPNISWTFNGKLIENQKSSRLTFDGKWGNYTCKGTTADGTLQRSFNITSSMSTETTGESYTLENVDLSFEGNNYTCVVSSGRGTEVHTFVLTTRQSQAHEGDTVLDLTGREGYEMNCDIVVKATPNISWTFNGKLIENQKSSRLTFDGKWGIYTCKGTTANGTLQRSFNITSSKCIIPRDSKYVNTPFLRTKPAISNMYENADYIKFEPGQTIILFCPHSENGTNSFKMFPLRRRIESQCLKEDQLIVKDRPYKFSELVCAQEPQAAAVVKKHQKCWTNSSELLGVGNGISERYEVCFDTVNNIPLYIPGIISKSNPNGNVTHKWHKYRGFATQQDTNTCEDVMSTCCYTKTQLLNARDVSPGSAQLATYIDPLNAVMLWRPCGLLQSPWEILEDTVRMMTVLKDELKVWSGTYMPQHVQNGTVVPRYLWKALEKPLALIYINGPSPSEEDILCTNICGTSPPWPDEYIKHIYCCHLEDFLYSFGLEATNVGDPLPGGLLNSADILQLF